MMETYKKMMWMDNTTWRARLFTSNDPHLGFYMVENLGLLPSLRRLTMMINEDRPINDGDIGENDVDG